MLKSKTRGLNFFSWNITGGSKGVTLSIWIWVIGGMIIGGIILLGSYYSLGSIGKQVMTQNVVDDFKQLNDNDISYICDRSTGSFITTEMTLNNVRGIYAADTPRKAGDDIPEKISDREKSSGKYMCMQIENQEPRCIEHSCNIETTYIGKPLPGTDMYQLGDGSWTFRLKVEKSQNNKVSINATHIP